MEKLFEILLSCKCVFVPLDMVNDFCEYVAEQIGFEPESSVNSVYEMNEMDGMFLFI